MDVGCPVAKGAVDIYAYFSKRHLSVLRERLACLPLTFCRGVFWPVLFCESYDGSVLPLVFPASERF